MAIEFEVKFGATQEILDAVGKDMTTPKQVFFMETTYYDTPDGALSARGLTLRRRRENDRFVCTLKTPAGNLGRGEFELENDRIEEAVPFLQEQSGIAELTVLTKTGLVPVCGARFTRYAYEVSLPEGRVEVALDSGILSGGGREIPLFEIEVELKEGSRQSALAYAAVLSARYGLQTQKKSKFRRALALYRGEANV